MVSNNNQLKVKEKEFVRFLVLLPIKKETALIINDLITEFIKYFGGLTISRTDEPIPFIGYWFDIIKSKICYDENIILFVDIDPNKHLNYKEYLIDLKKKLIKKLNEEDIWVTFYPINIMMKN